MIRRGFLSLLLAVAVTMTPTRAPLAQSNDNARYAAIVVDAESGEVLFARHADSRRYPASITKVMTLYLAFEALSEGRIKLDDVITVSPRAASQPPSKLGLAAGQTITVDDAMRATAVRSANDMAMALAEHIGGSQERFAAQMTLKARELGMTQTRYVNPNGLPDARQLTSARDLAILARAVMRDYPQYYRYFGQHDWVYNGREYRNTNGLLRGGAGYDGMKTGFTNASGYNLAASAVRDGRRLITIVLGGRSTATRNAHVAELMDTGFEVERARARGESIQVAQTFFEARGFGIGPDNNGPIEYASVTDSEDGESGSGSSAPPPAGVTYASLAASPPAPARVTPAPSERAAPTERPADVTAILNGGASVASPPRPRPPATREPARQPAGRWSVQVGAFRDETVARDWLTEVNRRFRAQFTAAERTVQNASGWYRSRFTGMTEQGAQAACAALAERRVTCMVVRPE
ncbi:MAG: serine hydrolase [Alphaproteobacteria bacterium]|jgi:D-alanyl-D-alanine carboxypeptidase|nr:serine hydrolase [Alphaproteobacteria bacterium]MBU2042474.1 serine hydrolase [Alphaproteobacteria bacterium]MBU2126298.1 serine hydrolase [Alphaproteobacteria bacterium]MBU2207328.1 serine hydrolase [Alphaproteobacteria bacterium]MBU2290590.1 serine hydrolase [Alphaproteobacteria bacterium]